MGVDRYFSSNVSLGCGFAIYGRVQFQYCKKMREEVYQFHMGKIRRFYFIFVIRVGVALLRFSLLGGN